MSKNKNQVRFRVLNGKGRKYVILPHYVADCKLQVEGDVEVVRLLDIKSKVSVSRPVRIFALFDESTEPVEGKPKMIPRARGEGYHGFPDGVTSITFMLDPKETGWVWLPEGAKTFDVIEFDQDGRPVTHHERPPAYAEWRQSLSFRGEGKVSIRLPDDWEVQQLSGGRWPSARDLERTHERLHPR